MQHLVLELDTGGLRAATRTLGTYLPGLSLGLVPLGRRRLPVPAGTVNALTIEYGAAQVGAILAQAGATRCSASAPRPGSSNPPAAPSSRRRTR